MAPLSLELLSDEQGSHLASKASALAGLLQQIGSWNLDQTFNRNVSEERSRHETNLSSTLKEALPIFQNAFAFLSLLDESESARLAEATRELLERTESASREATAKLAEIESIRQSAQSAAATSSVAGFEVKFDKAAKDHRDAADKWLGGLVASIALTFVVLLLLANFAPFLLNETAPQIVQHVLSRAATIGVLTYAIALCGRNYRAHRHLAVTNEHRRNALTTFEVFIKASDDPQTRNAVLLETTKCIFAPAQTGYLGAEDDVGNRVLEVTKLLPGSVLPGKSG